MFLRLHGPIFSEKIYNVGVNAIIVTKSQGLCILNHCHPCTLMTIPKQYHSPSVFVIIHSILSCKDLSTKEL